MGDFIAISREEARLLLLPDYSPAPRSLCDLQDALRVFAESEPAPPSPARLRRDKKIRAEVPVRNAVNKVCNDLTKELRDYFGGLIGCKVRNADGSLSKKVRADVYAILGYVPAGFECCYSQTTYSIFVEVKATYPAIDSEGVEYVKASAGICELEKQCVAAVYTHKEKPQGYDADKLIKEIEGVWAFFTLADSAAGNIGDFHCYLPQTR